MVSVAATVSGNTDIDTNQSHQQVSFAINNKNFPITYPQTDLKIWVYQNNRRDNAVTGLQPMTILENQISYTNNQNLIFPAGNEYRRMEFLSNKYNGMHVESISFHNPYYHVELMTDYRRDQLSYQYDQDRTAVSSSVAVIVTTGYGSGLLHRSLYPRHGLNSRWKRVFERRII